MSSHNYRFVKFLIVPAAVLLVSSCKKEPGPDPNNKITISDDTLMLNRWIWDGMSEVYLWEAYMPNVNITQEPDPMILFNKLLYVDDTYSWITDDYDALVAELEGINLSNGMEVFPGKITDTQVIAPVGYVSAGSPAADSGITRGDIVMTIDGQMLTVDNYYDLYGQTTATFGFGEWDGIRMQPNGKFVTLTSVELNPNPIVHKEIIEYEGFKIGYLFFSQFVEGVSNEWLDSLNACFDEFKSAGVTDVVFDMRYNPGGSSYLSAYIASCLGPASAMENEEVFSRLLWNDLYNEYWKTQDLNGDGRADGEFSDQLLTKFPHTDHNLDLSRIYFLTTGYTASASESLMIGLYPYSNVIQIGEKTYGKCYGSFTIDDWERPKRHNWAMQPIILKFANADGFTDFFDGISPDYYVNDDLLDARPFGSISDPLLAKALELISGTPPAKKKSIRPEPPFEPLPPRINPTVEMKIPWPGGGIASIF